MFVRTGSEAISVLDPKIWDLLPEGINDFGNKKILKNNKIYSESASSNQMLNFGRLLG